MLILTYEASISDGDQLGQQNREQFICSVQKEVRITQNPPYAKPVPARRPRPIFVIQNASLKNNRHPPDSKKIRSHRTPILC